MKISVKVEKEVKYLQVIADVRYWEDATVDGVEDEEGSLIPCRSGDSWIPMIDLDSGKIINWTEGVVTKIHYKVCDAGRYQLLNKDQRIVKEIKGYVPNIMCPVGNGYGDYIIMNVDENGLIENWSPTLEEFEEE